MLAEIMVIGIRLLAYCSIYRLRYNRLPGDEFFTVRHSVIRYLMTWQTS